jgi:hypothetical protein
MTYYSLQNTSAALCVMWALPYTCNSRQWCVAHEAVCLQHGTCCGRYRLSLQCNQGSSAANELLVFLNMTAPASMV